MIEIGGGKEETFIEKKKEHFPLLECQVFFMVKQNYFN